ncbi:15837_t:CDS:2, partial [Dentiscutata heterogama]
TLSLNKDGFPLSSILISKSEEKYMPTKRNLTIETVFKAQTSKPQHKKELFNADNREVYSVKETEEKIIKIKNQEKKNHLSTDHEIAVNYDLLVPVRNQKKNESRKYSNKDLVIKNTPWEAEAKRNKHKESSYYQKPSKIEGPINHQPTNNNLGHYNRNRVKIETNDHKTSVYYQEVSEVKQTDKPYTLDVKSDNNVNDDDNNETWYPCNDKIPEEWLGSNDHKELTKAELKVMESLDKSDEPDNYKEADEKIEYADDTEKNSKYSAASPKLIPIEKNYLLKIGAKQDQHQSLTDSVCNRNEKGIIAPTQY